MDPALKAGRKVTAAQLSAVGPGIKRAQLDPSTKAARAFVGRGQY